MDNLLTESLSYIPDISISSKQVFGTKKDIRIPAFSKKTSLVPKIDKDYLVLVRLSLKLDKNVFSKMGNSETMRFSQTDFHCKPSKHQVFDARRHSVVYLVGAGNTICRTPNALKTS